MISIQNFQLNSLIGRVKNAQVKSYATPAFKGGNLAPLQKDTVTFTGKHTGGDVDFSPQYYVDSDKTPADVYKREQAPKGVKRASKNIDQSYRGRLNVAASIIEDTKFAYGRLKSDISNIFNMPVLDVADYNFEDTYRMTVDGNLKKNSPILAITARQKTPESVAEKMGSMKILTKKAAKEEITDIVGLRILLNGNDPHPANYVMDKLTNAVNKGYIKITEIEDYRNSELRPAAKYAYANQSKIDALANASRKKGVKNFESETKQTESGYNAIHLLVELPDGIKGEIQIMGPDVLRLKEIEDLCYKCMTGKNIPKKYEEIKAMFDEIKDDPEKYTEFMRYTRQAYALERKRPQGPFGLHAPFLSIPEDSKLPRKFDFNEMQEVMKHANGKADQK